ncbi:MAG: DPP IV N-terminal domain-containing protein, partial [Muribaculaceae bacterium]|nr:DPP IV N-terminal domain-containing protein [Muribaculaceae bacterium]
MKKLCTIMIFAEIAVMSYALELQDFVLSQARPKSVPAMQQAADGEHYYRFSDESHKILKVAYKNGEESVLFDSGTARDCSITEWDGYSIASDESRILLWTASVPIYRHSFRADYYVYETRHNKLTKLTRSGGEEIATLSPDGRMVAYVKDNNIRLKKLDYDTDIEVTSDGLKNSVINGVPDWVYQEELGMLSSLRFSPDNSILAFARWDESQVPMYSMTLYEGDCNSNADYALYPGRFDFKYPVAGENNSVVTVHTYDIETRVVKQMQLPAGDAYYIQNITFGTQPSQLMVSTLNRTQNRFHIFSVNPRSCIAKKIYEEKSESWIDNDLTAKVRFYDDFFVIPSDKSGYTQLYQYSLSGALIKQLTSGQENVTDFYGYDALKKKFYYQATASPLNRVLMCVTADGKVSSLSPDKGTGSASFSASMAYFVRNFSDVSTPNQYAVFTAAGKKIRDLELNEEYAGKYVGAGVPRREFFSMTSDGVSLNGYIIKPLNFDPSKKYPVIMSQYSGPGSQSVLNRWKLD